LPSSPGRTEGAPSVLLPRIAAVLVLLCLAALGLAGCGDRERGQAAEVDASLRSPAAPEGLWFQLREGRFEQIQGPGAIRPTPLRPWTVQERVAGMVLLGAHPYLAVNGHGVAAVSLGPSGFPRFRPFYDPLLFGYRTFTRMLPRGQSLLCHVYFNSLLNETTADALELRGISLLELFPEDGVYRHRTPAFQRLSPDWECVGFAPQDPQAAALAWKHSGPLETRFAYTRLDLAGGEERAAKQEDYRSALAFAPVDGADPALRAVTREAARRLSSTRIAIGLQFLVRADGEPLERRYQILPPEFHVSEHIALLTLPVEERGGRFTLLTPDGTLLWAGDGSLGVRERRLPALPEGFAYTDLLLWEGLAATAWEQRAFAQVGAAGLFLLRDPALSP